MRSSMVAAHSTCVSPTRMMQDADGPLLDVELDRDRAQLGRRPTIRPEPDATTDAHRVASPAATGSPGRFLALGVLPQLVERIEPQRLQLQAAFAGEPLDAREAEANLRLAPPAATPPGRCPACGPG